MLKSDLISNSIYINAGVGIDSMFYITFTLLKKEQKIIFAPLSLYLLLSKIMEKHIPEPRILRSCFNPPSQGNPKARNMEESVREITIFSQ